MSSSAPIGRSILIIEDNADARDALRVLLELEGHAVEAVEEGQQAIELARAKDPDIALVDIGLPGMDGYQVARQLRASPRLRQPILVALTGYGQAQDRARSHEAGFDEHLVKPASVDDLRRVLSMTR